MFEHGYGIVIGVDDNLLADLALPTVAKDVQAVYDVLVHPERCAYDPDKVTFLKGEESTGRNIMDALDWLDEMVAADPEATAVIYYSGHGWWDKAEDQYYLIPYDIKSKERIRAYALRAETFNAKISDIQARRLLAVLDCCHSAGMDVKSIDSAGIGELRSGDRAMNLEPAAYPVDLPETKGIPEYKGVPGAKAVSDLEEGEGRAILNSSTGSQSSWTRSDGKMSIFTYHFIEALTGHAPHPEDATVVYVTDVMSWVTHQVKKSAAREGVEQTPVMKTSGVFPVAQLIGGEGVAKSKGETPPDPLAPLPQTSITTTFQQEVQTVSGKQTNIGAVQGNVGQIGDSINTGGGDYVGGDNVGGDKVGGDKVGGDKYEGISISGVQGSSIAFGRGSKSTVSTTHQEEGGSGRSADPMGPLEQLVAREAPELSDKVKALREQIAFGPNADDSTMAGLVQDLADAVPEAKAALVTLFKNPEVAETAGPTTKFVLGRL